MATKSKPWTAKQILQWLGKEQGTASKRDIRAIWFAWPDSDECVFVRPGSRLEYAGLRVGNHYTMDSALQEIGCK